MSKKTKIKVSKKEKWTTTIVKLVKIKETTALIKLKKIIFFRKKYFSKYDQHVFLLSITP